MKPQTMLSEDFFSMVCFELGLDETDADENTVIQAIVDLKAERNAADLASGINFEEWQKLRRQLDRIEAALASEE